MFPTLHAAHRFIPVGGRFEHAIDTPLRGQVVGAAVDAGGKTRQAGGDVFKVPSGALTLPGKVGK